MFIERYSASVTEMAKLDGSSPATWWNRIRSNQILSFRDGGRTKIVIDFPGPAPAREGRPPTYREFMLELLADPSPKRTMPGGVHRGRPRKPATE